VKVLVTSRLYPSSAYPGRGTFVHNQARFLSPHCVLEVIAPIPWCPPIPGLGKWNSFGWTDHRETLDGIDVRYPRYLSLPRRLLFSRAWRFYLTALRRAMTAPPDLIHAHLAYPDGLAAAHLGRQLGCPVVISVHGHDVRELPDAKPRWRQLVAAALEASAAVIASSADVRTRLLDLGIPESKIHFVPQGVDCQLFRPNRSRTPGADGWQLLYVGRFDSRKGLEVLLEAIALLRQRRDDFRLKLIGGSPVSGGTDAFRAQAARLELIDCVEFADEQPWTAIPVQLAAADLLVLPSFYDSFGIVLIEAMACGLPVVATRCGGPEDIVTDEVGRLVEVGNAESLAAGIGAVLDRYECYDREKIRRCAEERYDYHRLAARIVEIYEKVSKR
jgi:teichuronic acid biosynthesis glycosyltransferase TuaC